MDAESVEMFEQDLKNNLYRIWNRMSSGTYFPPPVRTVGIPKKDGSERRLGIPTVADRIAQTVVKMYLEPEVDPQFHPDSYGYRPRKSAIDALAKRRDAIAAPRVATGPVSGLSGDPALWPPPLLRVVIGLVHTMPKCSADDPTRLNAGPCRRDVPWPRTE